MEKTESVSVPRARASGPAGRFWQMQSFTRAVSQVINYILLGIGSFIFMVPFYWMVTTSIKDIRETYRFPPTFIPQSFTTAAYKAAWEFSPWLVYT